MSEEATYGEGSIETELDGVEEKIDPLNYPLDPLNAPLFGPEQEPVVMSMLEAQRVPDQDMLSLSTVSEVEAKYMEPHMGFLQWQTDALRREFTMVGMDGELAGVVEELMGEPPSTTSLHSGSEAELEESYFRDDRVFGRQFGRGAADYWRHRFPGVTGPDGPHRDLPVGGSAQRAFVSAQVDAALIDQRVPEEHREMVEAYLRGADPYGMSPSLTPYPSATVVDPYSGYPVLDHGAMESYYQYLRSLEEDEKGPLTPTNPSTSSESLL